MKRISCPLMLIIAVVFVAAYPQLTSCVAAVNVVTGPVVNPANGHPYYLLTAASWTDSEAKARDLGGHLAVVNDKAENDWLVSTFSNYGAVQRQLWIGLTDVQQEGVFRWEDGEQLTFTNWAPGEPNNSGGNEDFAEILHSGQWNDLPNLQTNVFGLVELAPLPAVIAGPIVNPANRHVYYLLADSAWTAAEAQAQRLGGHLATVNDKAENAWVYQTFSKYGGETNQLWIGLTDTGYVGQYAWIDGEPVTFTNWHAGEPNSPGIEHYGVIHALWGGEWNNLRDWPMESYPTKGVVEIVPTSSLPSPGSLSVSLGANVVFTLTNNTPPALVYQWSFSGQPLAGATNATLFLPNVQLNQAGAYTVSVASGGGIQSHGPWTLGVDPTFTKITAGAIVTDVGDSVACAWGDYDNDGSLDLIVANAALKDEFLYHNDSKATFTRVTTGPLVTSGDDSTGAPWGDFDNNGTLDLFVSNYNNQPGFLFQNNGNGTFTRLTNGTIATIGGMAASCAWGDYDNDGNLDLFVANNQGQSSFLFRGNGDGTFERITSGTIATDNLASSSLGIWGDFNGDGNLDLFVCNEAGNSALYRNEGNGSFTKITSGIVVNDGPATSAAWADYDNDGDLDLLVTTATGARLYINDSHGGFTKSVLPAPLSHQTIYGCSWGDYDNDGFLDLLLTDRMGARNVLYHNNGDGTFSLVMTGSIVNDVGHSWSAAWGDYDNDGFLDLFVSNRDGYSNFLYRNNGNANHWLKVKLVGTRSNRSGIGARVRLKAVVGGKEMWQLREVSTGGSFGQNALDSHFGLGNATNVETLRIEWPSGIVQVLTDVPINQFVTLTEPPVLSVGERRPTGSFELILTSRGGFNYAIDASDDLISWRTIGTLKNVNGSLQFVESPTGSSAHRFYRAVWLP